MTDPSGTYSFAYDNMNRLTQATTDYSFDSHGAYTVQYGYDAASNRTSMTAPDGSTTAYSYDSLNRLSTLANSWAGSFGFTYDALSRRTQLSRPNGVNTNYSYDSLSHLLSVLHQAGAATLDGASYTYDNAGNRISKTDYLNSVTSNYAYDVLYQLTGVTQGATTTESYSYDAVGNRLSSLGVSPYQYNSSNELTSTPSATYTYDANGNTLSDPSGKSYSWDFENRLTQAVNPGVGTTTFRYDPFGRRVQKSGPLGTVNFLYDGANLLEEVDNSGNVLARYTQSGLIDETLSEVRSGTTSYYQADDLSSITSLSNSSGALANTYAYDSFGNVTASSGSIANPFRFTGREFDSETGLYFYRSRYFDTNTGRFISEDPIGFRGGLDFYAYVGNNPLTRIDPSGMDSYDWYKKSRRWGNRSSCFISYYACLSHLSDTRQSLDQMSDDAIMNTSDATGSEGSLSNQRLKCALNQDQNCKDALQRCVKLGLTNPFPPPWWLTDIINLVTPGTPKPQPPKPTSNPNP